MRILMTLLLAGFMHSVQATDIVQHTYLERSDNLHQVGQTALKNQQPVVLFFNARYCLPCEKLKQRALISLLRFNQFPEGVQFIEVFIDDETMLTDFYGEPISSEDFALFYNVAELPTQVFVDGKGEVVAPPMVNNGAYEFYGQLINQRIESAQQKSEQPKQ